MAKSLSSSIGIAKPPAIVWDVLTAAEGLAGWYDDWDAVENMRPRGNVHLGSTFRLVRQGKTAWCRVTVADPPNRLRWLQISDDGVAVAVEFNLKPDDTGGTVLTHSRDQYRSRPDWRVAREGAPPGSGTELQPGSLSENDVRTA
jgi:uncharacterized protein YndB with AHSA1/START domain